MRKLFTIIIMLAAILTVNAQGKSKGIKKEQKAPKSECKALKCKNVSQENEYKTLKDISYISANDTSAYRRERCKLDMYLPTQRRVLRPLCGFMVADWKAATKSLGPN